MTRPHLERSWLLALLAVVVLALPAAARSPKKGALRQEVEQLRAQVTELRMQIGQLQSAVVAQGQRFSGQGSVDPANPVGVPGGTGLCADPCAQDSDGDGVGDCEDPCLCDPTQSDADGDGTPDCLDPCPDDASDACIDPCRWDSDGDGTNDCEDPCPWDPTPPTDQDENGVIDCVDLCWLMASPNGVVKPGDPTQPGSPLPCPILLRPDAPPSGG